MHQGPGSNQTLIVTEPDYRVPLIPRCTANGEILNQGMPMSFFLTALGLMMIFEGIPYFCFPNQVKQLAQKLPELENRVLRSIGFVIIVLGLAVVYFGRIVLSND